MTRHFRSVFASLLVASLAASALAAGGSAVNRESRESEEAQLIVHFLAVERHVLDARKASTPEEARLIARMLTSERVPHDAVKARTPEEARLLALERYMRDAPKRENATIGGAGDPRYSPATLFNR
jgi:hypothetical protein